MGRYYSIFTLSIISLVLTILYASRQSHSLFVIELYLILLLMMIASIGLYTLKLEHHSSWIIFLLYFAIIIFNAFYMHLSSYSSRFYLVLLIVFGFWGLLIAATNAGPRKKRPAVQIVERMEPKPEAEEVKQAKEERPAKVPKKRRARKKKK